MRTTRALTVSPSMFCAEGEYPSMHWGRPPPPREQNHTRLWKYNLAPTSLRAVTMVPYACPLVHSTWHKKRNHHFPAPCSVNNPQGTCDITFTFSIIWWLCSHHLERLKGNTPLKSWLGREVEDIILKYTQGKLWCHCGEIGKIKRRE